MSDEVSLPPSDTAPDIDNLDLGAATGVFDLPMEGEEPADLLVVNPHVTRELEITRKMPHPPGTDTLHGLMTDAADLMRMLEKDGLTQLSEEQLKELPVAQRKRLAIIQNLTALWQNTYYQGIDQREGSNWGQIVRYNDTPLMASRPKLAANADPVLKVRTALGQGSLVQIPLWHTGIWVTLTCPTNSELVELDQRIRLEKISLGRFSNGMVFANSEVYMLKILCEFVLDHVYSVTLDVGELDMRDALLDVIKVTDFPQLVYGLLCTMYPNGYPFQQPCVSDPDKCTHVEQLVLNIARMSWVDRGKLTEKQLRMMAQRTVKRSIEQLEEYQAEFTFDGRPVRINDSVVLRLGVPTIAESVEAGLRWVDGIATTTQKAFGLQLSEVDRLAYINRQGAMTVLRQYSQWIAKVELTEVADQDPLIIEDRAKIDEILEVMVGETETISAVTKEVEGWIDHCTVSYIALPKTTCPACQKEPQEEYLSHPQLIAVDVAYVFFTLRGHRIQRIERALQPR